MLFSNQQTLVSNQPTWAVGMKIDYKGQIKWMQIQKCAVIFRIFFSNINNVSNVWFFSQAETNVWVMYEWWPSCKTSAPLHCNGEGRSLGLVRMKQYWHSFFFFFFFYKTRWLSTLRNLAKLDLPLRSIIWTKLEGCTIGCPIWILQCPLDHSCQMVNKCNTKSFKFLDP